MFTRWDDFVTLVTSEFRVVPETKKPPAEAGGSKKSTQ